MWEIEKFKRKCLVKDVEQEVHNVPVRNKKEITKQCDEIQDSL